MRALRGVIVLALALALSAPVLAADFVAGLEAYKRGDYATALTEWRPLAEQGDAAAQFNLGLLYQTGWGVPQDYAEAVKWYQLAAVQGYASAQFNLGTMYEHGKSVAQDYAEAAKWYRLAAEQGDGLGQFNLSNVLGNGSTPDYVEAHMWATLAAEDSAVEDFVRDWALRFRDTFEEKMTPEQIAEAQRLAREWKPK